MRRIAANIAGQLLALFAQFITAPRADWRGIEPVNRQRIYFANHTSNADLPIVWTVLPPALRRVTRPVAAADYWLKTKARAFIGPEVFRATLMPFKAGIYNIAQARPEIDLVPTWIDNIASVMPSGEVIPVPLGCTVIFGDPMHVADKESKDDFLDRAAQALSGLMPVRETGA